MSAPFAVSTELDAVNQILSSVGQAPVTTLDQQNPEVAIALQTVREVNKQVQSEGWAFNTEYHYGFTPNTANKQITYPDNVLQLDTNRYHHMDDYDPIRRQGKFYDKYNHTYEWPGTIYADVLWLFNFEDVPPPIQYYITARAARLAATKMLGDGTTVDLLGDQEQQTRAAAIEYDCNQTDTSYFGWRDTENTYTPYQPFHTLIR